MTQIRQSPVCLAESLPVFINLTQAKMSGQLVTMAAALHAKDAPYFATLESIL